MNILQEKCFTKAWLDAQREQMRRVDPGLLEKSIHALELVGLLARKELPFSFKGGTCMLLLLENIRRLSIDVDIAYESIWPVENSYRGNAFSREEVLDDTIEAARLICMLDLRGCPNSEETRTLRTGIRQLDSHIIGTRFSLNEAKICAAKAGWLATALKYGKRVDFARYTGEELRILAATPLPRDLAPLNRLKGGNPEAYYHWLKTAQIA